MQKVFSKTVLVQKLIQRNLQIKQQTHYDVFSVYLFVFSVDMQDKYILYSKKIL